MLFSQSRIMVRFRVRVTVRIRIRVRVPVAATRTLVGLIWLYSRKGWVPLLERPPPFVGLFYVDPTLLSTPTTLYSFCYR